MKDDDTYGTDPDILYRSDADETSIDAAYAVDTKKLEEMVHEAIKAFGPAGCIQDEVLTRFPGYPYSSITARFSALIRKDLIHRNGEKRPGRSGKNQGVMVDGPPPGTQFGMDLGDD